MRPTESLSTIFEVLGTRGLLASDGRESQTVVRVGVRRLGCGIRVEVESQEDNRSGPRPPSLSVE